MCVYVFWGIIWQSFVCAHNVCVVSSRLFVGHHQISLHDVMTQGGSPGSVSTVHVGEAYFFLRQGRWRRREDNRINVYIYIILCTYIAHTM